MTRWTVAALWTGACVWVGCGAPTASGPGESAGAAALEGGPRIEVVASQDGAARGSDEAPRMTLALRGADGSRQVLPEQASAFAPFRDGVALVDTAQRLLLITPDGARRVLAERSGAPPAAGPDGELVYVVVHDLQVELHRLSRDGHDRVLGSGLASAGSLAPQSGGRVLFIGAHNGGVSGLWIAGDDSGARCLTNCALRTGEPWQGHVPLPTGPEALTLRDGAVEYLAADGSRQRVSLREHDATQAGRPTATVPELELEAPEDTQGATR